MGLATPDTSGTSSSTSTAPPPANAPAGTVPPPVTEPPATQVNTRYQQNMKVSWDIGFFKGDNISAYLKKYNLLATDCGIEGRQKLSRFTVYCADQIVAEIEARAGYKVRDWDAFEKSIKKYFFKKDTEQLEYQMPFVRTLSERQQNSQFKDVPGYCSQFQRIAEELMARNRLSQDSAVAEFFGGISEDLQIEIQHKLETDFCQSEDLNIQAVIEVVLTIEERQDERLRIVQSAGGPINPHILNMFSTLKPETQPSAQVPKTTVVPAFPTLTPTVLTVVPSRAMDDLSQLLGKLSLSLADTVSALNQARYPPEVM